MATKTNPGGINFDIDVDPSGGLKGLKDVQAEIKATVAAFYELKDAVGAARDAVATVGGRGTRSKLALLKEVGKATRSETRMNVTRKLTDTQRRASTAKYAAITRAEGENLRASIKDAHIEKRVLLKEQRDESTKSVIDARADAIDHIEETRTEGASHRLRIKRVAGKIGTVEHKLRQRFTTTEQKDRNDDRIRVGDAKRVNTEAAEKAREELAVTKGDQNVRVDAARGDQDRQTIESRARARRDVMSYAKNLRVSKMPTVGSAAQELMRGGLMKAAQMSRIPGASRWVAGQWKAAQAFPGAMQAHGTLMTAHQASVAAYQSQLQARTAAIAAQNAAQKVPVAGAAGLAGRVSPGAMRAFAGLPPLPPPPMPTAPGAAPIAPTPPNRFISALLGFAANSPRATMVAGATYLAYKSLNARYEFAQQFQGDALDLRRKSMAAAAATGSRDPGSHLASYYNSERYGYGLSESASIANSFYSSGGRGSADIALAGSRAYGLDPSVAGRLKRAQRFGGGLGLGVGTKALDQLGGGAAALGLSGTDATDYLSQMVALLEDMTEQGLKVDARSITAAQSAATRMAGGDSIVGRNIARNMAQSGRDAVLAGGPRSFEDLELARIQLGKKPGDYGFSGPNALADYIKWRDINLGKVPKEEAWRIQQEYQKSATKGAGKSDIGMILAGLRMQSGPAGQLLTSDQLTNMSSTATAAYAPENPADTKALGLTNLDPAVDSFEELTRKNILLADQMLPAFQAWAASHTQWASAIGRFDEVVTRLGQVGIAGNTPFSTAPRLNAAQQFVQTLGQGLANNPGNILRW